MRASWLTGGRTGRSVLACARSLYIFMCGTAQSLFLYWRLLPTTPESGVCRSEDENVHQSQFKGVIRERYRTNPRKQVRPEGWDGVQWKEVRQAAKQGDSRTQTACYCTSFASAPHYPASKDAVDYDNKPQSHQCESEHTHL